MEEPVINLSEVLSETGSVMTRELKNMVVKKKIKGKGVLGDSIDATTATDEGAWKGRLSLSFETVGRFVDMGAGRMRKIETIETNRALIGGKGRKPKKWYSKTAYGIVYGRLLPALVINLQASTLEGIKEPLLRYREEMAAKYGTT